MGKLVVTGKSMLLPRSIFFFNLVLVLSSVVVAYATAAAAAEDPTPTPTPWPHQFHSILYVNYSGALSLIDLWYDWPNGRNFNIIQDQLGTLLYDLEWNNGTSFFYTLDSNRECSSAQLPVGILRPNWLDGATYLGQRHVDGFLCNVWEKLHFIWYYEDVVSKRPVHWTFYTGRSIHVMTFEVGAVLEDAKWQAPVYCFLNKKKKEREADDDDDDVNTHSSSSSSSNSVLPMISAESEWRRLSRLSHSEATPRAPQSNTFEVFASQ